MERCHAAWKRRDAAGVLACYHPDITYFDYFQNIVLRHADLAGYVARSMPSGTPDYLRHTDRIRADGDTAFIQYDITVPLSGAPARFHASEAITVRDGLIWRIRDYAVLTKQHDAAASPRAARRPEQRLGLSSRGLGQLAATLDSYFETRRPHLDPALDLPRVARETGYTRNQISFLLNQVLGLSFYQYVTQKRLRHVLTEIAKEGPVHRIDALAHGAGFNSLSAFYRAFRQQTGVSPRSYLRARPAPAPIDAP